MAGCSAPKKLQKLYASYILRYIVATKMTIVKLEESVVEFFEYLEDDSQERQQSTLYAPAYELW